MTIGSFLVATIRRNARIRLTAAVTVLVACSSLGLHGAGPARRAHLSADLAAHQARRTTARTRVIVRGTYLDLGRLAARHHLQIATWMRGAAVVLANSAELSADRKSVV